MSNPEKTSAESSSIRTTPDKIQLEREFVSAVLEATNLGLADFLKCAPFDLEDRRERGRFALRQAKEVFPELISSLLYAILERDHWKHVPDWSRPKTQRGKTDKQKFAKIVDEELDELTRGSRGNPEPNSVDADIKRLTAIKRFKPLIHGVLSNDERDAIQRKEMGDMAIETLVNGDNWMKMLPAIVRHAVIRDKGFFERLGRALYNGVRRAVSEAELALTINWESPRSLGLPLAAPGLKFWRDEAVRELISALFYREVDGGLSLPAYRSMRDRIGLKPDKNKLVKKCGVKRVAESGVITFVLSKNSAK
jgi:hypothetical protein